jgi:hypothetical protein
LDRLALMRKSLNKNGIGIEIGPLHNSICSKNDGWAKTYILDVFTTDQLKNMYATDANIDTSKIEEVDLLYKTSLLKSIEANAWRYEYGIGGISNSFDHIVSSHNFEHQPNPIQFLTDCELCLNTNGILAMAIPIASRTFDCWLPLTTTGQALDRFFMNSHQPTIGSIFDSLLTHASHISDDILHDISYDFNKVCLHGQVSKNFLTSCNNSLYPTNYTDAHVSRFNHFSFELFFKELSSMEIITKLVIDECYVNGSEFIVKIRKTGPNMNDFKELTATERTLLTKRSIAFHANDILKSEGSKPISSFKKLNKNATQIN